MAVADQAARFASIGGVEVSLIDAVVDELAAVTPTRPSVRAAQLATTLRFVGELHHTPARTVLNAEVSRASLAHRIRADIALLYGSTTHVVEHRADGPDTAGRHTVCVSDNAVAVARQLGLVDRRGQLVRGLPAHVVGGTIADVEAVWRGALLAGGQLADPRRATVAVTCPTWETAVALSGAARRLDITAKARDSHRGIQVVIRGGDTISALLARLGAPATQARFDEQRATARSDRAGVRLTNFDNANEHRTQLSAAITVARVTRAFEILGDTVPAHLAEFGRLRLAHPHVTLEELGRLADPPVTKDTASGRLRRLLATADTRAAVAAIPDTTAAIPADLRDQL